MTSKYLNFYHELPGERKTIRVHVISKRSGDVLGVIKWYGAWRQYAFFPQPATIWNPECLDEINEEIRNLMKARR